MIIKVKVKAVDIFCQSCVLNGLVRIKYSATSKGFHSKKTYYEILELQQNASKQEIRAAFVDLSKKHHPDKNLDNPLTHDQFVLINKAYSTLIRPESRRQYDTSLAYRLHQQNVAKNMASTHAYDGSCRPDSWPDDSSEQNRLHDEYIFSMRDKSKDAYYSQQPYYGFKGVNRLSNTVVVLGCVGLLILGTITHFFVLGASSRRALKIRDERDKQLHASYMAAKQRARSHGTDLQLSLLSNRAANKSSFVPEDSIDSSK